MPALLASLPQDRVPLLATNLVGVDSLRQLLVQHRSLGLMRLRAQPLNHTPD